MKKIIIIFIFGIIISILSLFLVFTIVITAFVIDKFNKMGEKIDEKPQETVASEENQKDDSKINKS